MAEQQFFPNQNITRNPSMHSSLMLQGSKKPIMVPWQVSPPSYVYGSLAPSIHMPQTLKQQTPINSQHPIISPAPAYFYKNFPQPSHVIPENQFMYVALDTPHSFKSANPVVLPQSKALKPTSPLHLDGLTSAKKEQDNHVTKVKSKRLRCSKSEKSFLNKETRGIFFDYSAPCNNCIKKGLTNHNNSFAQQALAEINGVKEENKQLKLIIKQLESSLKEVEENLR